MEYICSGTLLRESDDPIDHSFIPGEDLTVCTSRKGLPKTTYQNGNELKTKYPGVLVYCRMSRLSDIKVKSFITKYTTVHHTDLSFLFCIDSQCSQCVTE